MKTKKCSRCGKIKPLNEFFKNKSKKDGYACYCKICKTYLYTKYRRTKIGVITSIYHDQVKHSKYKGFSPPTYTRKELINHIINDTCFNRLYDEWVEYGYKKMIRPSVDRLDDYKGYSLDNIQLMTWGKNKAKGHGDVKNGINNKLSKAVVQYTIDGVVVNEYYSINQAWRETKISNKNIQSACKGRYNSAGGYVWKYKEK